MSQNFTANQYQYGFLPHKLGNWEHPRNSQPKAQTSNFGTIRPRTCKTEFIVDDKGHLLKGTCKKGSSFDECPPVYKHVPSRWPKTNPVYKQAPRATMGYKGIMTSYLPTGTVHTKSVEVLGVKEFNFK